MKDDEKILVLKTDKEIKTYSSVEIEDNAVEGERDNDDNDEYILFSHGEST